MPGICPHCGRPTNGPCACGEGEDWISLGTGTAPEIQWTPRPEPTFASYCPHCYTGDPGEDYCGSCGEAL